jgi:hypothetical protein
LHIALALTRRAATARERLRQLAGSRTFADPTRIVRDRRTATDQPARVRYWISTKKRPPRHMVRPKR